MEVNLITKQELKEIADYVISAIKELLIVNDGVMANDKPYNNKEACKYLGVCSKTLQNYRDNGLITYSQVGRKITYTKEDLNNFLKKYKKQLFAKNINIYV